MRWITFFISWMCTTLHLLVTLKLGGGDVMHFILNQLRFLKNFDHAFFVPKKSIKIQCWFDIIIDNNYKINRVLILSSQILFKLACFDFTRNNKTYNFFTKQLTWKEYRVTLPQYNLPLASKQGLLYNDYDNAFKRV